MFYPRLCTITMTTKPIHVWWFSNWEACIRIARQIESISDSKILLQICIYSLEPVLVKKYPLILCMLRIYVIIRPVDLREKNFRSRFGGGGGGGDEKKNN